MLYKLDKELNFKKLPWYTKFYRTSYLFNFVFFVMFVYGSFTPVIVDKIHTVTHTDTLLVPEDIELTDEAITEELVKLGCVLPNVALAQMKIESTHFKSAICRENKNIAGIKTSRSKFCLRDEKGRIVKNRSHNCYATYKDCLKDYVRIQNAYLSKIDGRYAEAGGYVQLIKKFK